MRKDVFVREKERGNKYEREKVFLGTCTCARDTECVCVGILCVCECEGMYDTPPPILHLPLV